MEFTITNSFILYTSLRKYDADIIITFGIFPVAQFPTFVTRN